MRKSALSDVAEPRLMASNSLNPLQFYKEAYQAVTDFSFFRTIFQQPLSRTFLFLLFLCAHAALGITLVVGWILASSGAAFFQWAAQNFPPVEVQQGRLKLDSEEPVIRKYFGEEVVTFIFDGSAAPGPPFRYGPNAVLFGPTELQIVWGNRSLGPFAWSELGDFKLRPESLATGWKSLRWIYIPVGYLTFLVYELLGKSLQALILTLFGLSASSRYSIRLPYSQYLTIACYSLTPAIAVQIIVLMTGQEVPYFLLIYMATATVYTYLATQRSIAIE